jgi:uncharacterized SAM-binding protein YcdF (DUF218 family)
VLKQPTLAGFTLIAFILGLGYIPARIAIAKQQAHRPELILVLGGSPARERLAAQLASTDPSLKIWVSSGTSEAASEFAAARIPASRVYLDHRATDTVTNFTTVVKDLKRKHIDHVYLVTSAYHLPRAQVIATIVFGSQGIAVTPVTIADEQRIESRWRIVRDGLRSLMWLSTGRTGASLRGQFQHSHFKWQDF